MRVIPRMLRRAGLETAFSRGFNPVPRMSFGPALALGVGALEEVAELDLLLPGAAEDMAGLWNEARREVEAAALLERLTAVAPPGLTIVAIRIVAPGERRIGELIAGADYSVAIGTEMAAEVAAALPGRLAGPMPIERAVKVSKRRGLKAGKGGEHLEIDVRPRVIAAEVDVPAGILRFRLDLSQEPGESETPNKGVRPREVVEALCGAPVPDHRVCRDRLLARTAEGFVPLRSLGPLLNKMGEQWQREAAARTDDAAQSQA